MASDLVLRPATSSDLDAVAAVHTTARRVAGASFPPAVHSDAEALEWVRSWDLGRDEVWVAQSGGEVVGYARFTPTWLDDLYVDPAHQGVGVGTALLDLVKARVPDGFGLWVFETNLDARSFYARHGLVELEHTDGSGNEEQAPDIRMVWPGADVLGGLRRLIDEADDELGDLLARRAALTRAVQEHKREVHEVDDPARDAGREAEVARRVAARAPLLGEARVARIVHVIISESIGASR